MAGDVTGQGNGQSQFLAQFLQLIVYQMRGVLILPAKVGIHVPDYRQQIRSPVRIVFVDDFLSSDSEFTLDGNGVDVTIRFASSNWDLMWMYTYDSELSCQYEIYDADNRLIMREQNAY